MTAIKSRAAMLLSLLSLLLGGSACGQDVPTKFENRDTVGKTRHNLSQRQVGGGGPNGVFMDFTRNDYNEVCVYCHTCLLYTSDAADE